MTTTKAPKSDFANAQKIGRGHSLQQQQTGRDLQGREVTHEQQPWFSDRTKKIIALVSIAFLLCGVFLPIYPLMSTPSYRAPACTDGECLATLPSPLYSHTPVAVFHPNGPLHEFPAYLARVPFAGLMTGKGSDLCVIPPKKMPSFNECEDFADAIHKQFKEQRPAFYQETMQRSDIKDERGYAVATTPEVDDFTLSRVSVGTDKRKIANYKEALLYVQKNVLQNPSLFEGEARAIVDAIQQTSALINRKAVKNQEHFAISSF